MATTSELIFCPMVVVTVVPNARHSFIRVESLGLKDAKNPQFPAEAFSAKFAYAFMLLTVANALLITSLNSLSSMTGTFNATVQAQVDGASTAPIGGSAPPTSSTSGASSQTSQTSHAASTTSTSGSASHSGSASATGSGAKPSTTSGASQQSVVGMGFIAVVGTALAVAQLL
jgi:cobalamin biosynthesis Mg chelatase CobN